MIIQREIYQEYLSDERVGDKQENIILGLFKAAAAWLCNF